MRTLFIYFDFMKGSGGKYYEGIASISAVLKAKNHHTDLFHLREFIDREGFLDIFSKRYADNTDIAAFSCTTNVFSYTACYSAEIKRRYPHVITVCGGIHPTLCPEEAIQEPGLDVICIGEGERPMLELCDNLAAQKDICHIQNLWVKKDGQVIKNPIRPILENLDELPLPGRDLFDYENSIDFKLKRLVFMASRGCPFECSHCCNRALKDLYPAPASYTRFKSVDRIIQELKFALRQYPQAETICFHDDILTLKASWFNEFTSRYVREINVPYTCNSRFELLNEECLELLRVSGCTQVCIGLESGDDYIRKEILGRKQDKSLILHVAQLCREKAIRLYIFVMVGIPFENLSRTLNTVKLTAQIKPDVIQVAIYYPYARTRLYEICRERGYLTDKTLDSYFETDTILNLPDFPKHRILFAHKNFAKFVAGYQRVQNLSAPLQFVARKTLDFLWHHPHLCQLLQLGHRLCRKCIKIITKRLVRAFAPNNV